MQDNNGLEFDSDKSDESNIPIEHPDGMSYNEYTRRYNLNLKLLTWSRDSYGLFDFETRQPIKSNYKFDVPKTLIRVGTTSYLEKDRGELDPKYRMQAQILTRIEKCRNSYTFKSAKQVLYERATAEEKTVIENRDIETCYRDEGE